MRGHLAIFTVALLSPVLLFLGFLLWSYSNAERARLEADTLDVAREIASLVDRDIAGLFSSLETLASSPAIRNADFETFHRQALELVQRQGLVSILNAPDGQLLVNVRLPWGTPLPKTGLPFTPAEISTGRPYMTNLFAGRVSGRHLYSPVIGILQDGKPLYVLSFALEPERLVKIFNESGLPPEMTAAIVDRDDRVIARSRDHDRFVGQRAGRDFLANATGSGGTWSGVSVDGAQIFGAYSRSSLSGYRIGISLPYGVLRAPLWRSASLFAALGIVVTGLSTLLGFHFARRLTGPIGALADQAALLGRNQPVPARASGLREADAVGAELAAAAATRAKREQDLQEANDEIQRFAYIVSHDLRSPLVNIMGFTTELEALRDDVFDRLAALRAAVAAPDGAAAARDGELKADFDEAIGFIKASISRMDRLINAILRLSREGRREFKPEPVDMGALAAAIRGSMTSQAEAAGATVTLGDLPPVVSDRLALEQIFSNLVDNALKYLQKGRPGEVILSGYQDGRSVVYEVRDNGRGIEEKDRARVFELFRRAGAQDRPGEGIGLAHVQTLIRRLGGTIGLTSRFGQGSVFTVTLPRRWAGEGQGKAQ